MWCHTRHRPSLSRYKKKKKTSPTRPIIHLLTKIHKTKKKCMKRYIYEVQNPQHATCTKQSTNNTRAKTHFYSPPVSYILPHHHPTRRTVPRQFLDNAYSKKQSYQTSYCVPAWYASTGYGQHQTIRIDQKGAGTRSKYPCMVYILPPCIFCSRTRRYYSTTSTNTSPGRLFNLLTLHSEKTQASTTRRRTKQA